MSFALPNAASTHTDCLHNNTNQELFFLDCRSRPQKKKNEFSNQYQFSIISHPQKKTTKEIFLQCYNQLLQNILKCFLKINFIVSLFFKIYQFLICFKTRPFNFGPFSPIFGCNHSGQISVIFGSPPLSSCELL